MWLCKYNSQHNVTEAHKHLTWFIYIQRETEEVLVQWQQIIHNKTYR